MNTSSTTGTNSLVLLLEVIVLIAVLRRYQCCPLYIVNYSPGRYTARANPDSGDYVKSRTYFPPIGWTLSAKYCVTPARVQKTWPFYAKTIFAKMVALVETAEGKEDKKAVEKTKTKITPKPSGLSLKLNFLNELGFLDRDENIEALRKHKFNLDKCVTYLLDEKDGVIEI